MFPATVHLKEAISLALSGKLEDVWKDCYLSVCGNSGKMHSLSAINMCAHVTTSIFLTNALN